MTDSRDYSPWLTKAKQYLGTKETLANGKVNPFVTECFQHTSYHTKLNEAWCAAFTCRVLEEVGCKSSHDAGAASNQNIGSNCPDSLVGAILVWRHKTGPLKGHYHTNILVQKLDNGTYKCLGGNQSNAVTEGVYDTADFTLMSSRWPDKADGTPMPRPGSTPEVLVGAHPFLDWELAHTERAAWSTELFERIEEQKASYQKIKDGTTFHPQYPSMTWEQQKHVLAEVFCWTAYYESGWNPKSSSVDVGKTNDRDTWSVGLLQLSVCDQPNYGLKTNYGFSDLEDPVKNLHLGVLIMGHLLDKHGVICIPAGSSGVYWATLHPGGQYDKSKAIAAHTSKVKV